MTDPRGSSPDSVGRRLDQIREIAGAVNASSDPQAILEQIVFAACHHARWRTSGIMAVNRATGFSERVARYAPADDRSDDLPTRWSLDTSPSRLVVDRRQPVIILDAQTANEFPAYQADAKARNYRTVVVLSLNVTDEDGRELTLAVQSRDRIDVDKEELDILTTLAHLAAIAVTKAKLVQSERAQSARLRNVIDLGAILFGRVLGGESTEALTSLIGNTLLHPLLVVDFINDELFVGRSPEGLGMSDLQWGKHVATSGRNELSALVRRTEPTEFRALHPLTLGPEVRARTVQVHVEPIRVDGETVGGLVVLPVRGPLSDFDRLVAQSAVFVLGAQLLRSHAILRQHSAQVSDLLERLADGAWTNERTFQARSVRLGWMLSERSQLFAARCETGGQEPSALSETYRSLEQAVSRLLPTSSVGILSDTYILRVPCGAEGMSEPSRNRLIAAVARTLRAETGRDPQIVEGPIVGSLHEYPAALSKCAKLLALGRLFERKGPVGEADFGPLALLVSTLDDSAVPDFLSQTVGAIKAYDLRHRTKLLETAAVFLNESCRYQAAADRLSVHVSTIRYRLGRVRELFQIDLDNADSRFSLWLAIRLDGLRRERPSES